jgi:hypothetical protein
VESHTRARSLASPRLAWPGRGAGARHAREWSAEIRPLALRGRDYLLPFVSGTIIRGTHKTPNSQLVTPISIKLQRPDGCD